jgi:hypothetical protein
MRSTSGQEDRFVAGDPVKNLPGEEWRFEVLAVEIQKAICSFLTETVASVNV